MKVRYKLKLEVDKEYQSVIVSTEELGYEKKDWDLLPDEDKHTELQKYADSIPDQPYWIISNVTEL